MTCNQHQQIGELFLPIVRDVAEYKKWMKWHDGIKKELKKLISEDAELDKTHHLGKKMSWGRLDNYRPDLAWKKNNKLYLYLKLNTITTKIRSSGILCTLDFLMQSKWFSFLATRERIGEMERRGSKLHITSHRCSFGM